VDELVRYLGDEHPAGLRLAVIEAMGLTRAPAAVVQLKRAFEGEGDRELKESALKALGRVGNDEAAKELLRIRNEDPDYGESAGIAIGNIDGAGAAPVLLEAIDKESSPRVRSAIVKALANGGNEVARPKLRELFAARGEADSVRGNAVMGLADLGDVETVDTMVQILDGPEKPSVNLSYQVLSAAQRMIRHPAARPALREKLAPVLEKMSKGASDQRIRYYAASALRLIEATAHGGR